MVKGMAVVSRIGWGLESVIYWLRWARSEAEAIALQADGWTLARQRLCHHHEYAILLERKVKPEKK